jgi:hypothetical protein
MTLEEQLDNVQQAIAKAESINEYSIKDRRMKYATEQLDVLYKRESMLLAKIARRDAILTGSGAGRISRYID